MALKEDSEAIEITDAGDLRKWRTELPNLIDDLGLDPYERTLYVHYKRVCGANGGTCYESVRTTAQRTKMSPAKVSLARRDLEDRGLVTSRGGKSAAPGEGGESVKVSIVDIWELNFLFYSLDRRPNVDGWTVKKLRNWLKSVYDVNAMAKERLPGKRSVHQVNAQEEKRLPGKQKKEPSFKKEPSKKEGAADAADAPDPAGLTVQQIKDLDLTPEGWQALLGLEKSGRDRVTVKKFIAATLNQPPPAIQVYQQVVHRFPPKGEDGELWDLVDQAIGREPEDLAFWKEVLNRYLLQGWNPCNLANQLDFFNRREIPANGGGNGNTNPSRSGRPSGGRRAGANVSGPGAGPPPALDPETGERFRQMRREQRQRTGDP